MAEKSFGREIAVGVIVAALVAGGAALWNLGTRGGLIRALGGVTHEQLKQKIAEEIAKHLPKGITVASERIGPGGIEGTIPADAIGIFKNDQPNKFGLIPQADGWQICTLSDIGAVADTGSCSLHREGGGWGINAVGGLQCRVTCFRLGME